MAANGINFFGSTEKKSYPFEFIFHLSNLKIRDFRFYQANVIDRAVLENVKWNMKTIMLS